MQDVLRLDKLLGHSGYGSRKEIKALCKSSAVAVDGRVVVDSSLKVDVSKSTITVDGQVVQYARYHYLMLHKPQGVVSATQDNTCRTVLDLLPQQYQGAGLFPVGRLDKDTTGLLLLTNDGVWAHRITSPKKHIDKVYEAVVDGNISDDIAGKFASGIVLEDGMHCLPARFETIGTGKVRIVVREGKFHQVKRMCAAVGLTVKELSRLQIGGLSLDEMVPPGAVRPLSEEEKELPFR
jgi:16S rRNA pseudouridine516 synthase